jgi:hypothetical protein
MGVKLLRKLQLGLESPAGTPNLTSTVQMRMENGVIDDQRTLNFVPEDVGYLSSVDRTVTPKLLAAVNLDGAATYEQLPYLFEMGVKHATPAKDGTGSQTGYIRDYSLPTTAPNTLSTYTVKGGNDTQAEYMEYAFCDNLELSGKSGETMQMKAQLFGRQVTKGTFTSLANQSVSDILFQNGKLYIDLIGSTLGTTQVSNTLLGMDLKLKSGWIPRFTADGNKYFSFVECPGPIALSVDFTFEHTSGVVAYKDAWIAETAKNIQIAFSGPAVAVAGVVYTYKSLIINMAGKFSKFAPLGNDSGVDTYVATFEAKYDPTSATFANFIVVNELAALA